MLPDDIAAGDRLELSRGGKVYVSVVGEVRGRIAVVAQMPAEYGRPVMLERGGGYSAIFFTEKGMLRFAVEVAGYEDAGGANRMIINLKSAGERIQRRSFQRSNCVTPLTFAIAGAPGAGADGGTFEGVMKDISSGGLRFVTNRDAPPDGTVRCEVALDGETLNLTGVILQKQRFPKSVYAYQYRIRFAGLTAREKDIILRYTNAADAD